MFKYTNYQLATVISVPIVTILLLWTLAIFHKNRKRWRAFDIPIVAILVQSILRNAAIVTYICVQKLETPVLDVNACSIFVWLFNSIHTFQASCLTTLAVVGLFSLKLYKKQQNLKQYLTTTHVIYHLFCLTTLCACVGVAAILAKQETYALDLTNLENACKFMPFQLDIKFNVFIIVLHIFLTLISICTFLYICCVYFKLKKDGFNHLAKSDNHLSHLSLSTANPSDSKNYYDTYTIQRNGSYGRYDSQAQLNTPSVPPYSNGYNTIWKSDISNVSTTVSSTNSRRPLNKASEDEEKPATGLETIHPVLIVCYLFYHVPIIILCIFPHLVLPWSVVTIALWLGLLQDVLIPVSLGLLDSRFCQWVSKVYRCSEKKVIEGKLPHVGLDGKFRHFGSQPQSLETNQMLPSHLPSGRSYPTTEHKFPITNGSLYTSIDGRLPVIHNYRRHNNENRPKMPETNLINLGMHSSNLQRQDLRDYHQKQLNFRCTNCDKSHCSSASGNLNSDFIRNSVYNLNLNPQHQILLKPYLRHISLSQNSLRQIPLGAPLGESRDYNDEKPSIHNRNNLRLSKSYDSLNDLQSDLTKFKQRQREKQMQPPAAVVDSDEEYFTDSVNLDQNFDTLSTESSYSITTEANCDFEFYQNDAPIGSQFKALDFKLGAKLGPNNTKLISNNNFDSRINDDSLISENDLKFASKSNHLRLSQHCLNQLNSKLSQDDLRLNQYGLNQFHPKFSHDDLILNERGLSQHNLKMNLQHLSNNNSNDLILNQHGLSQQNVNLNHDHLKLNLHSFNQLKPNSDLRTSQNGLSKRKSSHDDLKLNQMRSNRKSIQSESNLMQNQHRLNHKRVHESSLSQNDLRSKIEPGNLRLKSSHSDLKSNEMDAKSSRHSFNELESDFPLTRSDLSQFDARLCGSKLSRNSSKTSSFDDLCRNYKIKRSNSKRSLENLQAYVDTSDCFSSNNNSLQRSNSFVVLDDRNSNVDYSRKTNHAGQDNRYENLKYKGHFYAGSVPDLKKVFITDFI